MKKAFALLLVALTVLSFAACGNKSDNTTTTTPTTTTAPATTVSETEATVVTTTEIATEPATTPATTVTPSLPEGGAVIEAGETEVFRGTVSDNIYMSAFSGLTFNADEKWTFLSDKDIATNMGVTEEDLKNDKLAATLKTKGAVYDMYAQLVSSENILEANVIVMLMDANNIDFKGKNLEECVDLLASQSFSLDLSSSTKGSASFGGESYYKVDSSTDKANVSLFGCQIGDVYVVCVTAASKESNLDLASMFK